MTPREKSRTLYGAIGNVLLAVSTIVTAIIMITGAASSDLTLIVFIRRMLVPVIGVILGYLLADDAVA